MLKQSRSPSCRFNPIRKPTPSESYCFRVFPNPKRKMVTLSLIHYLEATFVKIVQVTLCINELLDLFGSFPDLEPKQQIKILSLNFPLGRLATWATSPSSDANCKFRNCISNIIYGKDGKECELWFWVIFKRQLMHMLFWNRAICLEIIWVWPRRLLPINSNNLKWYANFINLIFIKN